VFHEVWPWVLLGLLGAYHGLNPAMGWLFAVALALQERSRRVLAAAFVPIAIGHAAAIGLAVLVVVELQRVLSTETLRIAGAAALVAFAAWKLWRNYSDALARRTFRFSIVYLAALFAALLVDHYLSPLL